MKYTLCLLFFGFCVAISHGQDTSSPSSVANIHEDLRPLGRVARQAMPPPPDGVPPPPDGMPPPPSMIQNDYFRFSRKKREARGGGSLPTRKG